MDPEFGTVIYVGHCRKKREIQMSESKKKRNLHLPEFKAKVGLEALGGMKTVNQIAQEYGVHPVQVGQWKREIQAQAKSLFEGMLQSYDCYRLA